MKKMEFALFFGNRGFFPGELIAGAREEMKKVVEEAGYEILIMDERKTRYGAVETVEEGRKYAAFLNDHRGKYDGVILSLPNFGDETGAVAALEDCGVPIFIQAYPDDTGKMDFANRRDSFCGKFSVMDVFRRYGLPFTIFRQHTIHPDSEEFRKELNQFAAVCRITGGMKRFTVGAIGARTTAFKTVRFDELALRCWIELELELGIAPCVILSAPNDSGTAAACELDAANAITMRALSLASEEPATVLDWNNNYGDEADKCILFHCGPVPQKLMAGKGQIIQHPMFVKSFGDGCGWGCNAGRIAPADMNFSSMKTEDGRLIFYTGEGRITSDPIEREFFGCTGTAEIPNLQTKLYNIGKNGFRHHVGMTIGHREQALKEAFETYPGYDLLDITN